MKKAIESLAHIDPKKPMGKELFDAVARISISVAIETVALRKNNNNGKIEVFLTKRLKNETHPGMFHIPGTILRPRETYEKAIRRIEYKEFKCQIVSYRFINIFNNIDELRGHTLQLIYICSIENINSKNWFSISNLPKSIISYHGDIVIPIVKKAFF